MQLRGKVFDKAPEGTGGQQAPATVVVEPAKPVVAVVEPGAVGGTAEPVVEPAKPVNGEVPQWAKDRIAKLTHDLNEERRTKAAAPVPEIKPGESPADFQTRVDEAATAKAVQIAAQADWDRQCNSVAELGKKEFPDFDARLGAIIGTINNEDPGEVARYNEVIAAAIETGQAHKVIYALGADPGEYQRIMKLSPVKRAMELGNMAIKLVNDKEPSAMPKPITPINAGGVHYDGITPDDPKRGTKLPIKEWMKLRDEQAKAKGIQ